MFNTALLGCYNVGVTMTKGLGQQDKDDIYGSRKKYEMFKQIGLQVFLMNPEDRQVKGRIIETVVNGEITQKAISNWKHKGKCKNA